MKIYAISNPIIYQGANRQKPPFSGSIPGKYDNILKQLGFYRENPDILKSLAESTPLDITDAIIYPPANYKLAETLIDDFLLPKLDNKKINSLLDLGCGCGVPTEILADRFKISPENVIGVDTRDYYSKLNLDSNNFNRYTGDMIAYLDKVETDKKFDMISLCRPICFYEGVSALTLLRSATKRLTDDGYFFTYGEAPAMDHITRACEFKNIKYESKEWNWGGDFKAILIPKSELSKDFNKNC